MKILKTQMEARKREKIFKNNQWKKVYEKYFGKFIINKITLPGSSNGRMRLSESCHLGSNPSHAKK